MVVPSPLESDYLGYWTLANNLYAGHGLTGDDGQPTAFLNLGYPVFLSGVFTVLGPTVAAVKTANVLLGAAAVLLMYLATRRMFGFWPIAALAAGLLACYLEAIVYAAYAAKENLMVFLLAAQLALAAAAQNSGGWRHLNSVLFGVATGCMAVVGNAGLALLPGFLLRIFFVAGTTARAVRYLAFAAAAGGLVIAPVLWRNHQVFDAYVLNNNEGFNLYIGNNPRATPYFESISMTPIGDQWQSRRAQLGEHGVNVMLRDIALQYMLHNPEATLQLAFRKAVAFWWPPVHSGKNQEGTVELFMRYVWLIQFCLIGGLFLLSTVWLRSFLHQLGIIWLLVGGYTAVHMVFYVVYRYRLPVMPVMCIGASVSAQMMLSWVFRNRFGRPHASLDADARQLPD